MTTAKHTSYNLIAGLTTLAVSLVTVPLYLHSIGLERFGLLSICWLLVGYFGLFELGLGAATIRRIAALGDDRAAERSRLLWTAIPMSLAIGTVGGILLLLAGKEVLLATKNVGPELVEQINSSMIWLAIGLPVTTTNAVLTGSLQGRRLFGTSNLFMVSAHTLSTVSPLIVAYTISKDLNVLVATVILSRLTCLVGMFLICRKLVPILGFERPAREDVRYLLGFGSWVAGGGIVTPILLQAEKLLVNWRLGAAALSIYVVPYNMVSRFLMLPQSLYTALLPDLSRLGPQESRRVEQEAVKHLCAITTPVCIAGMIIMPTFMRLWVGRDIGGQSAPLGIILLLGMWFNACAYIPHARLQGSGRPDLVTKISAAQVLPYVACAFLLIEHFGLTGAAMAWAGRAALEVFIFFAVSKNLGRLTQIVAPGAALAIACCLVALIVGQSITGLIVEGLLLSVSVAISARKGWPFLKSLHRRYALRHSPLLTGK